MRAVRLFLGLGLIFSASLIGAATHPVPLDKNTDSAKCIACHQDKAKGKAVHSAIATGCTSCHEIHNTPLKVYPQYLRGVAYDTEPGGDNQTFCRQCHLK